MPKKTGQKTYYFSDRLKRQLNKISQHPLTIVEAPSGFGKTTAVREYLRENLPSGAQEYWYSCLGEPAVMSWRGICELLSKVNSEIAANLSRLEMPTMDTLLYMMTALRNFRCHTETYLVIDNYQLVDCEIPRELMSVFAMHGNPQLHIIFITQQLGTRQQLTIHNSDIHTIDASTLFFDREGTASLFQMEGIRLNDEELERVLMSTEGWVSAIRLQIINYEEAGSLDYNADIEQLVENAIWSRLTSDEKEFLLTASVLESFNACQAATMIGTDTLPESIETMLKNNDFIRYDPDKGIYSIHNILQDFLKNRFYHHRSKVLQDRTFHLAGETYAANGQYYTAAQYFLKVEDFNAILSLPFSGAYLTSQKERDLMDFAVALLHACPEETLYQYPKVMLTFAFSILLERQTDTFLRLKRMIALALDKNPGALDQKELRRLSGEFALLKSFESYNNIEQMRKSIEEMAEIMGKDSSISVYNIQWTSGCTSILNMFWSKSGGLDENLRNMDEFLPLYLKVTGGHCSGADSAFRAEAMLMRGDDEGAEILCYRALYAARSQQQTAICLCVELTLARIAILRGDVDGYFTAVKNIKSYAKENSNLPISRMVDLCMSVISLVLGTTEYVAKWFYDAERMKKSMYAMVVPYGEIIYSHILLKEKQYNALYGISEQFLADARELRYILPQVCHHIILAEAKQNSGKYSEAQAYLSEALALAQPDGIYLPFAEMEGVEELLGESVPMRLKMLCRRQQRGMNAVKKAIQQVKSPLTPREREIALLAKERLSAKEIADQLYIAETTVRTILRSVYSKLDIHSKGELSLKEF